MAFRLKGLIALVLVITFVFMTLSLLLSQENPGVGEPRGAATERQVHFEEADEDSRVLSVVRIKSDDSAPEADIHSTRPHTQSADAIPTALAVSSTSSDIPAHPLTQEEKTFEVLSRPQQTQIYEQELRDSSHSMVYPDDGFRLLIGVMSPSWASDRRQIIRNAYRRFPKDLPVDVIFVQGDTAGENDRNRDNVRDSYRTALKWENDSNHDIMFLECTENYEEGKTYEYLKKVGLDFNKRYTHVMKTDDDSFVNIPGTLITRRCLTLALWQVIYEHGKNKGFYWGTTYQDGRWPAEMWGSGYVLSMDLVEWIAHSDVPLTNLVGWEDLRVFEWLIDGGVDYHRFINITAFGGYPWPELGDWEYKQENEIRPFERWTLVTHPLKEDFMWIETADWYLNLQW
jgi:Galactosyltransferase